MAEEVYELVARLTPEGAEETEEALQGAREEFEQTTESVEQSTDDLENFSARFEGAVGIAVTSLAVAAGGILANVPILGEAFAGIAAIIDSLGLKVDEVLRPALGDTVVGLFELADRIDRLDGPVGDLLGWAVLGASVLVGLAAGAFLVAGAFSVLAGPVGLVIGALTTVGGAIAGVVGGISLLTAGIALVVAAVVAFAIAYATNFMGVRDTTNRVIDTVLSTIDSFIDFLKSVFVIGFETAFDLIINAAKQWANTLVGAFEGAINAARSGVVEGINVILKTIINGVNEGIKALNKLKGVNIGTVGFNPISGGDRVSFGRPFETTTSRAILARTGRRGRNALNNLASDSDIGAELVSVLRDLRDGQRQEQPVTIDGRRVGRAVGGFGAVQTSNRGR